VTVLGTELGLARLHARGLTATAGASTGTPELATMFSVSLPEWDREVRISADGVGADLVIAPWLCRSLPEAEAASKSGETATESRIVELDDIGERFWTNGKLGEGFPTTCSWSTSLRAGQVVAARQDGVSHCSDSERLRTKVEVTDATGRTVGMPDVCVAVLSQKDGFRTTTLTLQRQGNARGEELFGLSLVHCLNGQEDFPFTLQASQLLSATCQWEEAVLELGDAANTVRLHPDAGAWTIVAVGVERDGRQVSVLDLNFGDDSGRHFSVRGNIDLPEVFE
jgi:hypothetical protein